MFHPDFYKVAVADCGCHDNRMDKVWWNELWMGYPVGEHYAAQSNVVNADKVEGKLLLIHGANDRPPHGASTPATGARERVNRPFQAAHHRWPTRPQ